MIFRSCHFFIFEAMIDLINIIAKEGAELDTRTKDRVRIDVRKINVLTMAIARHKLDNAPNVLLFLLPNQQ